MFMSVISLHELEHAVLLAERADPAKGEILREWLGASVVPAFSRPDSMSRIQDHSEMR